jgi:hypothetical protein
MAPFTELSAFPYCNLVSGLYDGAGEKVGNFKTTPPMAYAETLFAHEHVRLAQENHLLWAMRENQRLAQENMMLLQLHSQRAPAPTYIAPWPPSSSSPQAVVANDAKPQEPRRGLRQKFQQKHTKTNPSPSSTARDAKEIDVRSLALSISASGGTSTEAKHAAANRQTDAEVQTQARTTLMLRNIPTEYTRALLVELLLEHGYDGKFDLVYMPMDFQNRVGLGYAFINFESNESAEAFKQQFAGFKDWAVDSEKVCEMRWSDVQGLEAHFERYRNSPVMHESVPDEYQPALFNGSERVPFPAPTKLIRAPRHWNRAK